MISTTTTNNNNYYYYYINYCTILQNNGKYMYIEWFCDQDASRRDSFPSLQAGAKIGTSWLSRDSIHLALFKFKVIWLIFPMGNQFREDVIYVFWGWGELKKIPGRRGSTMITGLFFDGIHLTAVDANGFPRFPEQSSAKTECSKECKRRLGTPSGNVDMWIGANSTDPKWKEL